MLTGNTAHGHLPGTLLASESIPTSEKRPTVKEIIKITQMETFLVKPRWLFLKIHTNAGITGLGEPIVEGRAKTVATAIEELTPYLIGKDPRPVAHHWQAMYRHAFYRGGPILTSAISGVDQALWDIKGKALGVPVYEMLGGPTRLRARVYAHAGTAERIKQRKAEGFTAPWTLGSCYETANPKGEESGTISGQISSVTWSPTFLTLGAKRKPVFVNSVVCFVRSTGS